MNRLSREATSQFARMTLIAFLWAEGLGLVITLLALMDVLFGWGLGYTWGSVLAGVGICLAGVFVWLLCRTYFRLFGNRT